MGGGKVENSLNKMSIQNRVLVQRFLAERQANGLSENTLRSYASGLLKADRMNRKSFSKWTKSDCMALLNSIKNQNSRNAIGTLLKSFMRSLGKEKVMSSWTPRQSLDVLPDAVPNEEEILAILKAIPGMECRSFFHVLAESGARVGSILTLKEYQVSFDEYGAKILLPTSKTGMGLQLRLVSSAPILKEWLNNHPNTPDDRVWELSYWSVNRQFRAAMKKAGIQKPLTIHSLRHARVTQMVRAGMPEALLRQQFGWRPGSRMPERYTHLCGKDLDNAVLKANGIQIAESKIAVGLGTITCPGCGTLNDATYIHCIKCSTNLTGATASFNELLNTTSKLLDTSLTKEIDEIIEDIKRKHPDGLVDGHIIEGKEALMVRTLIGLGAVSQKIMQGLTALSPIAKQLDAAAEAEQALKK
jgi:integrase